MASAEAKESENGTGDSPVVLNFSKLFATKLIQDFPKPPAGKVLTLNSNASVKSALEMLVEKKILSAPVLDVTQLENDDANWADRHLGLIDMTDIVTFALKVIDDTERHNVAGSFMVLLDQAEQIASADVSKLLDERSTTGLVAAYEDVTVLDAIKALGKNKLHRFVVVPKQGKDLLNIITQSAMCNFVKSFSEDKDFSGALKKTALKDCGLGSRKEVIAVDYESPTLDAFDAITVHRVSAVPVVDTKNDNRLVGNVSARDIRSLIMDPAMLDRMFEPIQKFLQDCRADFDHEKPTDAIFCRPDDTLWEALDKLTTHRIHRIYLIDKKDRLMRVISLGDILEVLIS